MAIGPVVRVDNLTISYRQHPAVHHLSGSFDAGSLTAIIGPNGAGKSTLMSAIAAQIRPATGSIGFGAAANPRIGYLPQQAEIDRSFPVSVLDVVLLGAWGLTGAFRGVTSGLRDRALKALDTVQLGGFERRTIGELSVGQFQRVLFARLLMQDAGLILLDEPFNAIDARTTDDLARLVARWHAEGRTVIAVLHDFELVRSAFPQALLLARRLIAWGATNQVLTPENLAKTRQMAEGWDEHAPLCEGSRA